MQNESTIFPKTIIFQLKYNKYTIKSGTTMPLCLHLPPNLHNKAEMYWVKQKEEKRECKN